MRKLIANLELKYFALLGLFEILTGTFGVLGVFGDTLRYCGYLSILVCISVVSGLFSYLNWDTAWKYRIPSVVFSIISVFCTIVVISLGLLGVLGEQLRVPSIIQTIAFLSILYFIWEINKSDKS